MQKSVDYPHTKFDPTIIKNACNILTGFSHNNDDFPSGRYILSLVAGTRWTYDNENEFFSDYRKDTSFVYYNKKIGKREIEIYVFASGTTQISITAGSREEIESISQIFEDAKILSTYTLKQGPFTVFIGHGGSEQWRTLKNHLQDQHAYTIEAYEIGPRYGHTTGNILEQMLSNSSFAILVMTGEDKTDDGGLRARQNVIHEVGLFQGKLGFNKVIILVENGIELFSNIVGINQIRYNKNSIKETFGDVLATLKREEEEKNKVASNHTYDRALG